MTCFRSYIILFRKTTHDINNQLKNHHDNIQQIIRFPKYLIIKPDYVIGKKIFLSKSKVNSKINIEDGIMYNYELVGASISIIKDFKHYFSLVKVNNKYYKIDDKKVTEVNKTQFLKTAQVTQFTRPVVLMYKHVQDDDIEKLNKVIRLLEKENIRLFQEVEQLKSMSKNNKLSLNKLKNALIESHVLIKKLKK